jgi:hypothetical protein
MTMPVSSREVLLPSNEVMRRAFQKVCHALRVNGDMNDPMTELIVTKIVGLAKAGDYDPDRLCSKVLTSMGMGSVVVANKSPVLRPKVVGARRRM